MSAPHEIRHTGVLRMVSQMAGLVRRELVDIFRQPRLIVLLVLGPFIILAMFAGGYDEQEVVLRTLFVAPADSIYAEAIEEHEDELDRYLVNAGFTEDVVAASDAIAENEADLVVVFPTDPAESVLEGRQATITVLHDKIDPIQTTAVEVAAQLAVLELNASILESLLGEAQASLAPLEDSVGRARTLADALAPLVDDGDGDGVAVTAQDLGQSVEDMRQILAVSQGVATQLQIDADPEQQAALEEAQATLDELTATTDRLQAAGVDDPALAEDAELARELVGQLDGQASQLLTIDPEVIVRPFVSDTESLLRTRVALQDFFAPSALALLVQHLVVTLAAMALIRDESLGLFEVYRVGPISPRHVVAGKYLSFALIGGGVAALTLTGVIAGLGVPLRGAASSVALGVGLVILASIGLGLAVSGLARSELQAVQYAMIVLLAGLFFSGFFIALDTLRYPVKFISWALPVTYGIRILQDVMLRGLEPANGDLLGLAVQIVVYGAIGMLLVRRRLRVE